MFKKSFILLWIFQFCVVLIGGQSEGEQCSTTIQQGICSSIAKCPSILNDIKRGIRNHTICGYKDFSQIVCCPSLLSTNTAPPKPTTTTPRISVRKCNEYKEFAYNTIYIGNIIDGPAISKKVSSCTFTTVPLIVGGTEAIVHEFPHMALIGYSNGQSISWDCGGSLISEQFVLTAAHCFQSRQHGLAKYVRLGEHDLNRTDVGSAIDLNIIDSIRHPEYKSPSHYNDVGLFKLESIVKFNSFIRPACLPEQSDVPAKKAIATGWGNVAWKDDTSKSNVLLRVILDIFSQDQCNSTYRTHIGRKLNKGIVEEIQVCAGSKEGKMDTCQGDSGGPLQIYHGTHFCTYTVIGVTSFGKACAAADATNSSVSVYTRIFAYLSWIESVVWPNEETPE